MWSLWSSSYVEVIYLHGSSERSTCAHALGKCAGILPIDTEYPNYIYPVCEYDRENSEQPTTQPNNPPQQPTRQTFEEHEPHHPFAAQDTKTQTHISNTRQSFILFYFKSMKRGAKEEENRK